MIYFQSSGYDYNQNVLDEVRGNEQLYKDYVNGIDCSEIAEDLFEMVGGKGKIYEITSNQETPDTPIPPKPEPEPKPTLPDGYESECPPGGGEAELGWSEPPGNSLNLPNGGRLRIIGTSVTGNYQYQGYNSITYEYQFKKATFTHVEAEEIRNFYAVDSESFVGILVGVGTEITMQIAGKYISEAILGPIGWAIFIGGTIYDVLAYLETNYENDIKNINAREAAEALSNAANKNQFILQHTSSSITSKISNGTSSTKKENKLKYYVESDGYFSGTTVNKAKMLNSLGPTGYNNRLEVK